MYQVKVFNPVTCNYKMVGEKCTSHQTLEDTNKKACMEVWKTGLMVKTVKVNG